MPAPSPVLPSASTAPRCQIAFSALIPCSTTLRDGACRRATTTRPTPQEECSSSSRIQAVLGHPVALGFFARPPSRRRTWSWRHPLSKGRNPGDADVARARASEPDRLPMSGRAPLATGRPARGSGVRTPGIVVISRCTSALVSRIVVALELERIGLLVDEDLLLEHEAGRCRRKAPAASRRSAVRRPRPTAGTRGSSRSSSHQAGSPSPSVWTRADLSAPSIVSASAGTVTASIAAPAQRWHILQWHAPKPRLTSRAENRTAPHRQCPVLSLIIEWPSVAGPALTTGVGARA